MNIDNITKKAMAILENDRTGHGIDHIKRVLNLSLKFAENERADKIITSLVAILHDVDDYKLVGQENANELSNAIRIMKEANIEETIVEQVVKDIKSIGYSKRLNGIVPQTIEAKVVSDADMCDAIGANGILRAYQYSISKNQPFFDSKVYPIDNISFDTYTNHCSTSVCHMFEKLLKLKNLMLTNAGKIEAIKRHQILVDFLYHFFDEENADEWKEMLDKFLTKNKI